MPCKAKEIRALFSHFVMRLELGLGNFPSGVTRRSQPGINRDTYLGNSLISRAAERRARFEVGNIGDPRTVLLGPEHDDGIAVAIAVVDFYSHSIVPGGLLV